MKNQKGFTLVELLVVIAIIGILSSVAVVNLNGARDKAKAANVQATLSQLSTAMLLCADAEANASGPTTNNGAGPVCDKASAINVNWPNVNSQGFKYRSADYLAPNNVNTATGWKFVAVNGATGNVNCSEGGCRITN